MFQLEFQGAAEQVTGSLHVVRSDDDVVLLECGLVQGSAQAEEKNRAPFPVPVEDIDAVVLSHAHIDHSGRVPLLVKRGYRGPIYAQRATEALCRIMLPDSGYLNEKQADWENNHRKRLSDPTILPLYTRQDAEESLAQFHRIAYDEPTEIVPGLTLRYRDAGHILGSAIVELTHQSSGEPRRLVFSGDLGYRDAPVMDPPETFASADAVLMESTYGDRLHRPFEETIDELTGVFDAARAASGNVLIPAFTVGRTQDLLYLMAEYYDRWNLDDWIIVLDSPMGINATEAYFDYRHLYGARLFAADTGRVILPNFRTTRTSEESMTLNQVRSGAIIIAGSGMCSGGRIHHHLKHNIGRPECHLVIVGYQAHGTLGRRIVDGAETIRLWGNTYPVRAQVHTIGGLSAHADQSDLVDWYATFADRPPVYLVHGEPHAQSALVAKLQSTLNAPASIAKLGQTVDI